jgi:hypothetical protein
MRQHRRWRQSCAALALCVLLACAGCSGQDSSPVQQDEAAEQTAAASANEGKVIPGAKSKGRAPGGRAASKAAAAAKAAKQAAGQTAAATAGAVPANGAKAPGTATGKGKSASRPQKGTLTKGLSGKDLDAALLKVTEYVHNPAQ